MSQFILTWSGWRNNPVIQPLVTIMYLAIYIQYVHTQCSPPPPPPPPPIYSKTPAPQPPWQGVSHAIIYVPVCSGALIGLGDASWGVTCWISGGTKQNESSDANACIHCDCILICRAFKFSLAVNSSSPNTDDVTHVTISVTMFPVSSLLLVGTVLYLVIFSVTALSGSCWLRGRDRVTEPLA